jgi:hypothetical protein
MGGEFIATILIGEFLFYIAKKVTTNLSYKTNRKNMCNTYDKVLILMIHKEFFLQSTGGRQYKGKLTKFTYSKIITNG